MVENGVEAVREQAVGEPPEPPYPAGLVIWPRPALHGGLQISSTLVSS